MYSDWAVKEATVDLPIRLNGNSEHTSVIKTICGPDLSQMLLIVVRSYLRQRLVLRLRQSKCGKYLSEDKPEFVFESCNLMA